MSGRTFHHTDPIEVEIVPRPGGPPRRMARLSSRDARAWHGLGGRVAAALEPRMGPEVVANRALRAGSGWVLEPVETARSRLRKMLRAARRTAPDRAALLTTDVEDFFPSVRPDDVARSLLEAGSSPRDAAEAAAMLEGWASFGYRGLPIGPSASAVLANALLRSVDEVVGLPFVRWVDDYLVVVTAEGEAAEVIERVDEALGQLTLSRSTRKTHIGASVGWLGSVVGASGRSAATPA